MNNDSVNLLIEHKSRQEALAQFAWENNSTLLVCSDETLYGYFQEELGPWLDTHHLFATCSFIKVGNRWEVNYGKGIQYCLSLEAAKEWAKTILGVKVIRHADFSMLKAGKLSVKKAQQTYRTKAKIRAWLWDAFNVFGWRLLDELERTNVALLNTTRANNWLEEIDHLLLRLSDCADAEEDISPWLMWAPEYDGDYLLCQLDGKIQDVRVENVNTANATLINEDGTTCILYQHPQMSSWLWALKYKD